MRWTPTSRQQRGWMWLGTWGSLESCPGSWGYAAERLRWNSQVLFLLSAQVLNCTALTAHLQMPLTQNFVTCYVIHCKIFFRQLCSINTTDIKHFTHIIQYKSYFSNNWFKLIAMCQKGYSTVFYYWFSDWILWFELLIFLWINCKCCCIAN